jgi:hypothetical protein
MPEACGTTSIIATARISLNVQHALFFRRKGVTDSPDALRKISLNLYADLWPPYPAKLFTNSIKLRNAMPDGPFAIHGF